MFKDLRQGNTVYVLDQNNVNVKEGTVQSVSFSHMSIKLPSLGMVVDVTITVDGNTQLYEIKDSSEVAYIGTTMLITPNLNKLLDEINQIKSNSESILKSIDLHKLKVEKCNSLLTEFDPVYKEKELNEQRFSRLENAISKLTESNDKLTKILDKLSK